MKIVTLVNEKGGVGKTTLATHIAAGMALYGYRVMIIDADAQGHATFSLGLKKEAGLYDLLVRDANFEQVVRQVDPAVYAPPGETVRGSLIAVPSNVETRTISGAVGDNLLLVHERLSELEGMIDYVVIDTSPTPSLLHGMIYVATDAIVYPTELETLSLDGLAESIRHKANANITRQGLGKPSIEVAGVQPTMYRVTNAHDDNLQMLLKQFGRFTWPAIPQRTIWVERALKNQMLYRFAPGDEATAHAWALTERVLKGVA